MWLNYFCLIILVRFKNVVFSKIIGKQYIRITIASSIFKAFFKKLLNIIVLSVLTHTRIDKLQLTISQITYFGPSQQLYYKN